MAAFVVDGLDVPAIPLGSHLDDWMGSDDFTLAPVVVMGYPPIPFSKEPILVTSGGEVNAMFDHRDSGSPHFLVSAVARGGFSGGPCLLAAEEPYVLGVVTQALSTQAGNTLEPEYMAVLTVERIYECLADHGIVPRAVIEEWHGSWARPGVAEGLEPDGA